MLQAATAFFLSYWLIKVVPLWGLSLIATTVIYLGPLIYISNREIIDTQIANASEIANAQAVQLKELAGQHTSRATETIKGYAGDYTTKAQEMIGSARGRSASPEVSVKPEASPPAYSAADFPRAPKQEPFKAEPLHA